ncbi:MAG TPA: adenylate/guanylate cyclase domain-containing protein [Candidatus Acidoferrales bacterium]|nr:adenylate/guanylate cyclase domain-containing protein [Candidatus Acidoferrales bacterium]
MSAPGARTATFLITDIEASTRLWEEHPEAMAVALGAHDGLLRAAVEQAGGTVVKTTGDGLLAAFDRPAAALVAALAGQHALERHAWPASGQLRVRMAIHSGSAESRDGDFFGPALNRVARLLAIGHGGQVLASGATAVLVADELPPGVELLDQGEHRLRDLERPEHVYQLAAPGLRRAFPPLRSAVRPTTNLPLQVTSFVGRERELAEVARLLDAGRLVTLVGVGGTGKTRLALQAATDHLERDGAWLVELAPVSDPGLVVGEIARALGVQAQPGQPPVDTLVDYLRAKELLLLLDNCEHLVGAAAEVAHRLLGSCPGLRVLASSREPLGVEGEAVFAVPSLALPAALGTDDGHGALDATELAAVARSEAVRLFVERATAIVPAFSLDAVTGRAVVEICRRLDGIPLALELAAARVNVLSPDEIAQGLGDRFRLLTGGRRTAAPRQQTLQAAIDWSWDLLDEADRRRLRRLSVFAGGWTLEAAAAVTRETAVAEGAADASAVDGLARLETLDGLGRLVDRSLVVVDRAGATRYRMLETIRQYAGDRLVASGEAVALRDRQLQAYRQLALDAESGLEGPAMPASLARLDADIDNLRAALDWAFESHPEAALEMCKAMSRYWRSRAMGSEGLDRTLQAVDLVRALPDPESETAGRARSILVARALAGAAMMAVSSGRGDAASFAEKAVVLGRECGDPVAITDAIGSLMTARVLMTTGQEAEWRTLAEEALRLATDLGDWARLSGIQASLAMIEARLDPATADRWLEQASDAASRSGSPQAIGSVLQVRGRVASRTGRLLQAQRWFRESQAQFEAIGDRRFALSAQSELAHALRLTGAFDEAGAEYRQTIRGWQQSGNRGAVANQLESLAFLAVARGHGVLAARLLGAAEALREVAEAPMTAPERVEYEAEVHQLSDALEAGAFSAAWADGRRMTADEAVAFALSADATGDTAPRA